MSRPYVICHMATSLDGRILPDRWRPASAHSHVVYEEIHKELGGGSWLVGRVTGQEFAKGAAYPDTSATFDRTNWICVPEQKSFAVVMDPSGKIAWGRADIDGDPIVVILSRAVADSHLEGLRRDGVSYIFAGDTDVTPTDALNALHHAIGIDRLMLEGGGHLNGAFLREGLIDEISLILTPAVDGRAGAPALFDGDDNANPALALDRLELTDLRRLPEGSIWVRYGVHQEPAATLEPPLFSVL